MPSSARRVSAPPSPALPDASCNFLDAGLVYPPSLDGTLSADEEEKDPAALCDGQGRDPGPGVVESLSAMHCVARGPTSSVPSLSEAVPQPPPGPSLFPHALTFPPGMANVLAGDVAGGAGMRAFVDQTGIPFALHSGLQPDANLQAFMHDASALPSQPPLQTSMQRTSVDSASTSMTPIHGMQLHGSTSSLRSSAHAGAGLRIQDAPMGMQSTMQGDTALAMQAAPLQAGAAGVMPQGMVMGMGGGHDSATTAMPPHMPQPMGVASTGGALPMQLQESASVTKDALQHAQTANCLVEEDGKALLPSLRQGAPPVRVNVKQVHAILRRREHRAKQSALWAQTTRRKKYMHESRHKHAKRRVRGARGRFLSSSEVEALEAAEAAEQRAENGKEAEVD